jgi:hypothetical protein
MPKQAYVSISDLAWDAMGHPDFEKLKVGYVGDTHIPGRKYEVIGGIPATAKLTTVIYVYEDESLEDVQNPLSLPATAVVSKTFAFDMIPAVFKMQDGTEILRTLDKRLATEFYEMYQYQPLAPRLSLDEDISPVLPIRFKLSEKDSQGRYVYLPAN